MAEVHELRWDFGHPLTGSCKESLVGGNHLRYYRQEHTGAYFLAVSAEKDLSHHHDIIENGYNLGRDYLVGNFTGKEVDTKNLKPGTVVEGSATFMGWTFHTRAEYVDGLLEKTSGEFEYGV
jgi:hypothetical protein